MGISIKQALAFVLNDENWVRKTLLGGLLMFFPSFAYLFPGIRRLIFDPINYYLVALYFMVSLIILIAVCGYFFKSVHIRIVHEENELPNWNDFWNYIYIGTKAYIGGIVVALPFWALSAVILFYTPMTLSMFPSVASIPYLGLILIIHVVYSFIYTMLALNFSLKFSIHAFWNIKKAYTLIHGNLKNFALLVANCLLVAALHLTLCLLLMHAHVLALIIPFVSFYAFLIYSDLFAQFVLNNKDVEITKEERGLIIA